MENGHFDFAQCPFSRSRAMLSVHMEKWQFLRTLSEAEASVSVVEKQNTVPYRMNWTRYV